MRTPTHTEAEVRDAVSGARGLAQALRRLGLRPAGGNYGTLRKLIALYGISTDHMDPNWVMRGPRVRKQIPLDEVLVPASTYNRFQLKRRLYEAGLKSRQCELCGQGEIWRGEPMALILDHINGVGDDNRIENLRIVCPNCAATFDTHCGRKNRIDPNPRSCLHCGKEFRPRYPEHRYCSHACGVHSKGSHDPHPERRKVERPPYEQLMAEIEATSYSAVGRKYGVSDNAVRKWVRWYEVRIAAEQPATGQPLAGDAPSGAAGDLPAGPTGDLPAGSAGDPPRKISDSPEFVTERTEGVRDDPVFRPTARILPW